jgi:multisubunit Na+/H+ antiporter MnhF subunit
MHPLMMVIATVWLAGLLATVLVLAIVTRSMLTRILVLDVLTLLLIAALALVAAQPGFGTALDAALVLALLSFVGTLAAVRFYRRGGLFG